MSQRKNNSGFVLVLIIMAIFSGGCDVDTQAIEREECWKGLPLSVDQYMDLKEYTVVYFKLNPVLRRAEAGTSWKVVAHDKSGVLSEKMFATTLQHQEKDTVVTLSNSETVQLPQVSNNTEHAILILPRPLSYYEKREISVVLMDHSGHMCFTVDGAEPHPCSDIGKYPWKTQSTLLTVNAQAEPFIRGVKADDVVDRQLKSLYTRALVDVMIKKYGTSLSKEEFEDLKKNKRLGALALWLPRSLEVGAPLTAAALIGNFYLLPVPLAAIGLNWIAQALMPPDTSTAEYGTATVTRYDLASYTVSTSEVLQQLAKAHNAVAEQTIPLVPKVENHEGRLEQLEELVKTLLPKDKKAKPEPKKKPQPKLKPLTPVATHP